MSTSFDYHKDSKDNIEEILRGKCLDLGVLLWNNPPTLYQITIKDTFKESRGFIQHPNKKEPYEKTIRIESMPPETTLPIQLEELLTEKEFKLQKP